METIEVQCPVCGKMLKLRYSVRPKIVECPQCKYQVAIPEINDQGWEFVKDSASELQNPAGMPNDRQPASDKESTDMVPPPLIVHEAVNIANPSSIPVSHTQKKLLCPVCGKDDKLQKVSAVVSTNQHSSSSVGSSTGVTYDDGDFLVTQAYTSLKGSSISELAKALTPPAEPKKEETYDGLWGCCAGGLRGCLVMVAGLIGVSIFGGLSTLSNGSGGVVALLLIAAAGFVYFKWRNEIRKLLVDWGLTKEPDDAKVRRKAESDYDLSIRKRAWETSMVRWTRSYYCHRDGIVFDPLTNESYRPNVIAKQIEDYTSTGHKFEAIKLYREHTGKSFEEGQKFIENLESDLRTKGPGRLTNM
ncbi:MAG: hypothetical protein WCS52_07290 [bacterium]